MKVKKIVLIGTALSIFNLPIIANANLITTNYTSEYSSANVTSTNPANCSGQAGGVTPPNGGELTTTTTEVKILCGSKTPCNADIIMESSNQNAITCTGHIVGKAVLNDLVNDTVSSVTVTDSRYDIQGQGTNHITIRLK
jgi:hypothetical protein